MFVSRFGSSARANSFSNDALIDAAAACETRVHQLEHDLDVLRQRDAVVCTELAVIAKAHRNQSHARTGRLLKALRTTLATNGEK